MSHIISKYAIGNTNPMVLISGPCVVESEETVFKCAKQLSLLAKKHNIVVIFKASVDKANRTSHSSFRGPGVKDALEILKQVKNEFGLPIITDVHDVNMVDMVSSYVDMLQIPAFLCRQTDLLQASAATMLPVNIKKGQFMSPRDMLHVLEKVLVVGNKNIMLCERGASFGYNNLVVDYRSLAIMRDFGFPVIFDATHSVQLPGAGDGKSQGERRFASVLAKASLTVGIAGVFAETHPDPDNALSDGPNSIALANMDKFIGQMIAVDRLSKQENMQECLG